jgi:histidinol-phosphate aminotransferase
MNNSISRRSWLKASIGIASGVAITPAFVQTLMAAPLTKREEIFFGQLPPTLKMRLNANENPYGPSEKAKKAVIESLSEGNRYPFQVITELKEMIAAREGISVDNIAVGAGSGELLCATGVAYGIETGGIVAPYPTFPLLMMYADVFKTRWDKVDLNEKLEIDYNAVASAVKDDTRLVFVCNPNNPTGTFVDPQIVRDFCKQMSKKVTVFVDEAYLEFVEPAQQSSMIDLVKAGENVIVSRTFSKIYGLAGLRIGYIIARPDIIKKIARYQPGFSVTQAAIAAAKASLGDENMMTMSRKKNAEARKILTNYLDKKGYFYGKSHTNFIFLDPKSDAQAIMDKLAERGIGIRVWDYQGKIWNRISIGTVDEMKVLVKNLEEVMS